MKKFAKKMLSMLITCTLFFSATTALAATEPVPTGPVPYYSDPVVSLCLTRTVDSSSDSGLKESEEISSVEESSKSLWYNDDPSTVKSIITTYDNKGAVKHYRDKVEVYVYQEGQGYSGNYTLINGERKAISGIVDTIISGYPRPFKVVHKYVIERKDVDPNEPYTIFTVGNLGASLPGVSATYTRHETNLYIYWNT